MTTPITLKELDNKINNLNIMLKENYNPREEIKLKNNIKLIERWKADIIARDEAIEKWWLKEFSDCAYTQRAKIDKLKKELGAT